MFETLQAAPPDAIFGLNEAFAKDPRPEKMSLGAGVYKDESGKTPIFAAVKAAERRLLEHESTKIYLPIAGSPDYAAAVQSLLFGEDREVPESGRAVTIHAPGGTGALRMAMDFSLAVSRQVSEGKAPAVWLSAPTWPNHPQIVAAAGLRSESYPYFDPNTNGSDLDAMLDALGRANPGDLVLLHGCCHNPTGVDLDTAAWERLADLLADRRLVPLVDFAYQGFAHGLRDDAAWLPILLRKLDTLMIASSYSKNFGLYNERTGALTVVAPTAENAAAAFSHLKRSVRVCYSNPPAHGGAIFTTVLGDDALRSDWEQELGAIRTRIRDLRRAFVAGLDARGVQLHASGNGFITEQNGMFSFSGLSRPQVEWLQRERAVYIVGSGRINVAGIRLETLDSLCDAVAEALRAA